MPLKQWREPPGRIVIFIAAPPAAPTTDGSRAAHRWWETHWALQRDAVPYCHQMDEIHQGRSLWETHPQPQVRPLTVTSALVCDCFYAPKHRGELATRQARILADFNFIRRNNTLHELVVSRYLERFDFDQQRPGIRFLKVLFGLEKEFAVKMFG